MGFKIWHYLARFGVLILLPILLGGFFAHEKSFLHLASNYASGAFFCLGLAGAVLAVRLFFTRFRFECLRCKSRTTEFGVSGKQAMWFQCLHCGHTVRETGFLNLRLEHEDGEIPNEERAQPDGQRSTRGV